MIIDLFETHDRHLEFLKKDFDIGACCQDLIDKRPFGNHPFYIFAHPRTDDDGVTKRLVWQPRLTKPEPQTNSMLFKGYPGTDNVKIIWMIPEPSMWNQYQKGYVTESSVVSQSIHDFKHNRKKLMERESDDLSDEEIDKIYTDMRNNLKPKTSVV